jgi:hypothetical protein
VRGALIGALILVVAACARPTSTAHQAVPTPSPSPTPTTPLALTATAPFHIGEVGIVYAPVVLAATGGVLPYKWSISDGSIPAGLTLGSDGTVSGTPASAGTFAFTVQVADAGDSTATIPAKVPIAPALSASLIPACATQCSVELGCVNACGDFGQQSGGVGPYSYALTSGQVPSGTSLSGLSLSGTFAGSSGYLSFSLLVTDSLGATASVAPTFWMYEHISLAGDNTTCYRIFTACSLRLRISGGIPQGSPYVSLTSAAPAGQGCWPQSPTPLPAGYTLTVSGGYVNLYIPRPSNGYGGVWTLVVTDHTDCAVNTYCVSSPTTATIGIECT